MQLKFACPKCGSLYTRKSDMKRHWKWECGIPPRFGCPVCGKLFKRKTNLRTHIGLVHPEFMEPI